MGLMAPPWYMQWKISAKQGLHQTYINYSLFTKQIFWYLKWKSIVHDKIYVCFVVWGAGLFRKKNMGASSQNRFLDQQFNSLGWVFVPLDCWKSSKGVSSVTEAVERCGDFGRWKKSCTKLIWRMVDWCPVSTGFYTFRVVHDFFHQQFL